jgi:hypothetical protein
LPDGVLDLQWGVQGKVQVIPGGLAIKPNDLLPLADGSVLVAGVAANVDPARAVVFHLKADGSLDRSFGSGGIWQRTAATDGATATSLAASDHGAVAVCVVARGDHPVAEIWSIATPAPKLIQQEALDPARDGEDMRAAWSGSHWAFGTGNPPTMAGLRATLDPLGLATEHAAISVPSDPGQGGFSPFAANGPAPSSTATTPVDAGPFPDTLALAAGAAMLAAVAAVVVSLRVRRRKS